MPPIDDIQVVVGHPHSNLEVPLRTWMNLGPGPRPLVRPLAAIDAVSRRSLPLRVVPLRYRNSWLSRTLIRVGLLNDPWAKSTTRRATGSRLSRPAHG